MKGIHSALLHWTALSLKLCVCSIPKPHQFVLWCNFFPQKQDFHCLHSQRGGERHGILSHTLTQQYKVALNVCFLFSKLSLCDGESRFRKKWSMMHGYVNTVDLEFQSSIIIPWSIESVIIWIRRGNASEWGEEVSLISSSSVCTENSLEPKWQGVQSIY